jgi:hypothetical protein
MCAAIPGRDRDTGEARILKAGKINESQRKVDFPEPVKRSLFTSETAVEDGQIFWHVLDVDAEDRPPMLLISNDRVSGPHVEQRVEISSVMTDGRYIRPPDKITDRVPGSFEYGTQTVAAFIADILRIDEAELRDAYDPEHSFFGSAEEYTAVLDETIPRYVFYVSHEYMQDAKRVDYYFFMSQEAFSYSSLETRQVMLVHGNILADDRVFAVLDELDRTGRFSIDISLF